MEILVEQRLSTLLAEPVEKLHSLPEFSRQEMMLDGEKIILVTYHDVLENGNHRVVVQARRDRWGGIVSSVTTDGYEFSEIGSARRLGDEELYDFT